MKKKAYLIKYKIYLTTGAVEDHETKVKQCDNLLHAKIKLGEWAKKRYYNFAKLEITDCDEDFMSAWTSLFGNGKNNPFGF